MSSGFSLGIRALLSLIPVVLAAATPTASAASFIQNPSFEANYNPDFPHYGPIDLWAGGSGVNEGAGPFHNTGIQIPDQGRAGFMQASSTLRQSISGLTAGGIYCLQFYYDARNCCGGTVDLITRFGGTQVDRIANVRPTPTLANHPFYYFRSVIITAAVETAELEFATVTIGDATAVLDAISLTPCAANSVTVANPSFEASGTISGSGTLVPGQKLAGWEIGGAGLVGINANGQGFADNGIPRDQDHVVFLQGASSISLVLNGLVAGTSYELSFAYNQRAFDMSHLRVTAGSEVVFDADITDVGGPDPYHTFSGRFEAHDVTATITFEQTVPDMVVLLDDIRVQGSTRPPLPCLGIEPTAAELAPGMSVTATATVPAELTAGKPATIVLRTPNPAVVELVGAAPDGTLQLDYGVGDTVKTFTARAVNGGTIRVEILESAGLCTENDLQVTVHSSLVRNSSFESSAVPPGIGYGSILAWSTTGGAGLNSGNGPFHDNGSIPDRAQVAFIQGEGSLSQQIVSLVPGYNYRLQFFYNARNCCGGSIDLHVSFDGKALADITGVTPVGAGSYHFHSVDFTPSVTEGLLVFRSTAAGDASVLLDAVNIVQRESAEIVIQNSSFEGTGIPSGVGYIQPGQFGGWTASGGGYGVNLDRVGPFTDNGDAPDQELVGFLQGAVAISQDVSGFEVGQTYTLSFAVNARNCCSPPPTHFMVTLGGQTLADEDIAPAGGSTPYSKREIRFVADSTAAPLNFSHRPPAGDYTLLLDEIRICRGDCRTPPRLSIRLESNPFPLVRISWPSTATGFILQSAESLLETWDEVFQLVQMEGDEFVVYDDPSLALRAFYRLTSAP